MHGSFEHNTVHMLWVYGELSQLEKISAKSFIKNGFSLIIWTYGKDNINIDGANIKNAREVLPESEIFLNKYGSYAGFSDLFRYCVLDLYGGIYVDTDVISIKHFNQIPNGNFLVTERIKGQDKKVSINGNVISYRNFREKSIIEKAKKYAFEFPKSELMWGEIGPALLSKLVVEDPNNGFAILPPHFANPLNYWDCPEIFISNVKVKKFAKDCCFIHLYNEMWRRKNIDKNKMYSLDTLYGKLITSFG